MKIAICDDEENVRRYVKTVVERVLSVEADLYACGEDLIKSKIPYDIVFLDICLGTPGDCSRMDGMETARRFRDESDAVLIFITAAPEFVYEAYDVEAYHYLLKPIDEKKLCEVAKRAAKKAGQKKASQPFIIKCGGRFLQIPTDDIFYGESDGRKIILHTRNGTFTYYEKMEALEQKLGHSFFRSHRGFLVHLQEVACYDRTSITLKCGDTVFLAKQKYNDFVTAYMEFLTK